MIRHLAGHTQETAAFWDGARRGVLMLTRCIKEGRWLWPPVSRCPHCEGQVEWGVHQGSGVVASHTIVRRAPDPALAAEVPYVVAAVDLAGGVRLIVNLVDVDPEAAVPVGLPVRVAFRPVEGDVAVPVVVPDDPQPQGDHHAAG